MDPSEKLTPESKTNDEKGSGSTGGEDKAETSFFKPNSEFHSKLKRCILTENDRRKKIQTVPLYLLNKAIKDSSGSLDVFYEEIELSRDHIHSHMFKAIVEINDADGDTVIKAVSSYLTRKKFAKVEAYQEILYKIIQDNSPNLYDTPLRITEGNRTFLISELNDITYRLGRLAVILKSGDAGDYRGSN